MSKPNGNEIAGGEREKHRRLSLFLGMRRTNAAHTVLTPGDNTFTPSAANAGGNISNISRLNL